MRKKLVNSLLLFGLVLASCNSATKNPNMHNKNASLLVEINSTCLKFYHILLFKNNESRFVVLSKKEKSETGQPLKVGEQYSLTLEEFNQPVLEDTLGKDSIVFMYSTRRDHLFACDTMLVGGKGLKLFSSSNIKGMNFIPQ